MNAAAWEAFTERAGIMEYEGNLDRKTATLRACEICFPADYRAMKEAVADEPDGETLMYEYLEELIKNSLQSVIEGATLNAETKNAKSYGNALKGLPQGREPHLRGFERLAEYAKGRTA